MFAERSSASLRFYCTGVGSKFYRDLGGRGLCKGEDERGF